MFHFVHTHVSMKPVSSSWYHEEFAVMSHKVMIYRPDVLPQ